MEIVVIKMCIALIIGLGVLCGAYKIYEKLNKWH